MNKKYKLILSLSAVVIVASSFTAGAYGAGKLKLIINGKMATAEVKTIDNTTYVPLRAVSEMLGASVSYDSATSIITINSSGNADTLGISGSSDQKATTTNSRSNPAELGETLPISVKDVFDDYSGTLSITQVIRGEQAWKMVQEIEPLNEEPKPGYEYLMLMAKITVTEMAEPDTTATLSSSDFTLVSTSGETYDEPMIILPRPMLDGSVYLGSSREGWVTLEVKKSDKTPLVVFERRYKGTGGVWFKTK